MIHTRAHAVALTAALALSAATATAQSTRRDSTVRDTTSKATARLNPVKVLGRIDDLIGSASSASEGRIGRVDLQARPITREGELLETVPGLIVTQHSGDGKANQYFVRGFNLDHGTDFATRVEGMPVNLPTHGHGQGYTDLNFIIPELVDYVDYKLGVSHASLGDFGSAGGAELHLPRSLARPFAVAEAGAFGLGRLVAAGSGSVGGATLLLGGEGRMYDGPWDLAQGIRKASGMARYSWERGHTKGSVLAMAYTNSWRATDQIPLRAVDAGTLSRFGAIDTTDGGHMRRFSLSGQWQRVSARGLQDVQLFAIHSDLALFSNFSYFLDDPVRGDQFEQDDQRTVLGANARHIQSVSALGATHTVTLGVQSRLDLIGNVSLHHTQRRARLGTVRSDEVREGSVGTYLEVESRWRPWVRTLVGGRADGFAFNVTSDNSANSGSRRAAIASPKASLVIAPGKGTEVYVSGGFGFHSNDARGTTITVDPRTGDPVDRVDPLVRSRGGEVGLRVSPRDGFRTTLVAWTLALESELLFVGDAGATEPTDASHRAGITLANFWRVTPSLSVDADASWSRARLTGVPSDANGIPGALGRVVAGGITWTPPVRGLFAALRLRHFGAYPLIEDRSVTATATTLLNADVGYRLTSGTRVRASLLNLSNTRAQDIQYWYTSRLPGEARSGVDGVHSHPVEPRQLRLSLEWQF